MDSLLPLPLGLKLQELRDRLGELVTLVDERAALDAVGAGILRTRTTAEELDRLAPGVSIMSGDRGLPRHLWFAGWTVEEKHEYPDRDVHDMLELDYPKVARTLASTAGEPQRAAELRAALMSLEGQAIEFKKAFPEQTRDLAHEIAALAPSGGSIYLGVDNDGQCVGITVRTVSEADQMDLRIRGIAEKSVDPPVGLAIRWWAIDRAIVAEIQVGPSGEPIHYVDRVPYIRDGSVSRPARPAEVIRAIREHDARRPHLRVGPGETTLLRDQDGKVVAAFAHIKVTNLGQFLPRVRAYARFLACEATPLSADLMPLRWSSAPEPLSPVWTPEGPRMVVDQSKIPASYTMDFAAGDAEDAAVAIRFADSVGAWGWTGESYLTGWRHPRWQLPGGLLVVEITVRAEGRELLARFGLDTEATLAQFAVASGDDTA